MDYIRFIVFVSVWYVLTRMAHRTGQKAAERTRRIPASESPDRSKVPGAVMDGLQKSMELMDLARRMAIARMEMECERAICCYYLDKIHMDRWGHAQDALSELESQIAKKLPF